MDQPNVVIDTNILISAQRSRHGAASKLLSLVGTGLFDIHVSVPLILEYEDVLLRQQETLGLAPEDIEQLIDAICALAVHHEIFFLWRPYLHDAKDEFVLELAIKARCDFIVTYNRRDFEGAERFGIAILEPKALLQQIGELS